MQYLYFIACILEYLWRALRWAFSPPYYLGIVPIIIIVAGAVWISLHPDENRKQWDKLVKEAEEGDTASMLMLCYAYEQGNEFVLRDKQKAAAWARKAATAGNATAMNKLGYMYTQGDGVKRDFREALLWFVTAMENGNAAAFCNAGYLHWRGLGVSKDKELAVRDFLTSAKLGSDSGMLALGCLYAMGDYVEQDKEQAIDWIRKAAQAGNKEAAISLKKICGEEIKINPRPHIKLPWEGNGLKYSTLFLIAGCVAILIVCGAGVMFAIEDTQSAIDSLWSSPHPLAVKIRQVVIPLVMFPWAYRLPSSAVEHLYGTKRAEESTAASDDENNQFFMQKNLLTLVSLCNLGYEGMILYSQYGLGDEFASKISWFFGGYGIVALVLFAFINGVTQGIKRIQGNEARRRWITIWVYIALLELGMGYLGLFYDYHITTG